jgi:predicted dehydrogenase
LAEKNLSMRPAAVSMALTLAGLAESAALGAGEVRLVTFDPGHFHAALVQKFMYPQVAPVVHVYAPEGEDLSAHLKRIADFNARPENPTHWEEKVYSGSDYLERMLSEKAGNLVVISGNNTRKTSYLRSAIKAGFNVLADKPMAINPADFEQLRKAFDEAAANNVLLYDIMTERFEITSILQRELAAMPDLFGTLQPGSPEQPAIEMESVHYFFKEVSGKPLVRPAWFFDIRQEGEAIQDVGTHLIDVVQWECFPGQMLDWKKDIQVLGARRWPTRLTLEQFKRVTSVAQFPEFLKAEVGRDGLLNEFANGEVRYIIKGVHAKVTARWDFQPPTGGTDTHYCVLRGTRARLEIRQGPDEKYVPTLYVENTSNSDPAQFEAALSSAVKKIELSYPGLQLKVVGKAWALIVPAKYQVGHEAHFAEVMESFLRYLAAGKLPDWEAPNMLAKYYTTTEAFRLSHTH